ncbi:hypothetical protein CQW31_02585 [Pseudomonas sp. 382]|nr:hypothetical protein CQW31_02585 [Pseudomonas sp. 382]
MCRQRAATRPQQSVALHRSGAAAQPFRDTRPLLQSAPSVQPACKDKCNRLSERGFASATFRCTIAPLFPG